MELFWDIVKGEIHKLFNRKWLGLLLYHKDLEDTFGRERYRRFLADYGVKE